MLFASSKNDSDRRQYSRVRYSEPVGLESNSSHFTEGGLSSDLSAGGLRLNVPKFIPIGTEISVRIHLDNGQVEDCQAKVAWVEKQRFSDRYFIGLQFLSIDSAVFTQRRIHRFIDALPNL